MGELEDAMRREQFRLQEIEGRRRQWREESERKVSEFVNFVTAQNVDTIAVYTERYVKNMGRGGFLWMREVPTGGVHSRFNYYGEGWVVTDEHSEGVDHRVVMLNHEVFKCSPIIPEPRHADVTHAPYVTAWTSTPEENPFSFNDNLAKAALKLTGGKY